jgi:hypothetical protein
LEIAAEGIIATKKKGPNELRTIKRVSLKME